MAATSQAKSGARRRPAATARTPAQDGGSRQDHRRLIETSPDGILLTLQNRITYVNRAGLQLFGARRREQLDGRSLFDFFDTAAPLPPLRMQEVMAGDQGGPVAAIGKLYRLDRRTADIELLAAPYRRGDQAGSLLILHPLHAADPAFAALCAPAAALELAGSAAALAYFDAERICRFANPVHESWFGGAHDTPALLPATESWRLACERIRPELEAALAGDIAHRAHRLRLTHGMRTVMTVCLPDRSGDGRLRGATVLFADLGPAPLRAGAAALWRDACATPPVLLAQLDDSYRLRFVNDRHAAPFALCAANGGRRLTDFVSGVTFASLCRYAKAAQAAPPAAADPQEQDLIAAISDIARLRRAEDQLYRREREFKTLVENSPDVIARIGRDMRHLYVSPAVEAAFGFQPAACLGKTKAELGFPAPTVKIWDAMVGRAFRSGGEQQFGFSQMIGEQARYFSVRVIPEFDRDGEVESVLAITYDVTDRTRLEQEREQLLQRERDARIQAETAARARDEFLAIVSHELRGPLNGIQSWAHVLENQVHAAGAPPLAQRALHGIRTGVEQQVRLIEDLLDVTRMMSGRLRLVKRPFSVLPAIQAAVESVREAAAAKNIAIATRYHIATEKIDGDPDRVQQVVWNLMSNAIKFTPENGSVEVDVFRQNGEVRITVADNGAGVAPDFLPHLFDRFSQKDTSSTRGHSGLGLGLFLVQHLVELHGGRIEAASAGEGLGAAFTLSLPLRDKPESYAFSVSDGGSSTRRLPSLAGRHVLLLDDQQEAREAVTAVLTAAGARVFAAGSTAEIFRWLPQVESSELPDVLVCDIAMPGEDGYAALRRIRTWKARRGKSPLQRLPALALTAFSQPEDRIQALTAGFQMHLTKPVAPDELLVVLASLAPRQ